MSDESRPAETGTGQIQLVLGPDTAPINHRPATLLWGFGTIVLGVILAVLLARGEIRNIVLVLLFVLGVFCLAPRRGTYIVLIFLPFMYYLRRQVLYFNEFSSTDPILLFPPLVTIAMFLGFIIFYGDRFFHYIQTSWLMKFLMVLQVIYFVEIFNPLQGNLLVGVAGALYFIIPMLWVFMGLLLDERGVRRILAIVVVIGTLTSAYAIYQHFFGFTEVERYELEAKNFFVTVGNKARVMSTFASVGDFSLYVSTSAFIAFAYYWRSKTRLFLIAAFALILLAMVWGSVRASLFTLAFSIVMFLIVYARDRRIVVLRAAMAVTAVVGVYSYLYAYTPEEIWHASGGSKDPFVVHAISGVAHPTEEVSFQKRIANWGYILRSSFTTYPVGRGLGSTTPAAKKFSGGRGTETDSMFFELMFGSSPLASLLFLLIAGRLFLDLLNLATGPGDVFTYRVAFGLLSARILGSIFGYDLRDVVNAPL